VRGRGRAPRRRRGGARGGAAPGAPAAALRGRVLVATTGEPLARAVVRVEPRGAATAAGARAVYTDDAGAFTVGGLRPGAYVVRARALGHVPGEEAVTARAGDTVEVVVRLAPTPRTLAAVRSEERTTERERFDREPSVGAITLSGRAVRQVPAIGEPDVLRAAQLLAGVVARNDYTAGYNVRGGESDQNLVLLDGIPVYNPFHLGGLFGTFVDQAVGSVEMQVGGFGAEYGGRLSSVLDVRSREEGRPGVHGAVSASLLSSSAAVGGGVFGGRLSWNVAARRTYADAVVGALTEEVLPYHFSDAQLRVSYHLPRGGTLALTAYAGSDALDGSFTDFGDSTRAGGGDFLFTWGNRLAGVEYRQPFRARWLGDSAALTQRASVTEFSTELDLGRGSLRFVDDIREARLAGQLAAWRGAHAVRAGYELSSVRVAYDAASVGSTASLFTLRQRPSTFAAYVDDTWRPAASVLARLGARVEGVGGASWAAVSPRASVRWYASPDLALTLAGGRYAQWTHAVRNEDTPVRIFDFWVTSDPWVPVATSTHLVAGAERWAGRRGFARVEAWTKGYDDIPEPNDADDPARRGDEFLPLRGRSYGVDVLLRRLEEGARLGGWVSYGYSVSRRERRDPVVAASPGAAVGPFWPAQDRRHTANVVGSYRTGEGGCSPGASATGPGRRTPTSSARSCAGCTTARPTRGRAASAAPTPSPSAGHGTPRATRPSTVSTSASRAASPDAAPPGPRRSRS
jgi:hypothetical protein